MVRTLIERRSQTNNIQRCFYDCKLRFAVFSLLSRRFTLFFHFGFVDLKFHFMKVTNLAALGKITNGADDESLFSSSNIEISLSVDVLLKSISWFGIVSNDKD